MEYTTTQAAKILNVKRVTVQHHCKKLGIEKLGRDYRIDANGLERLKNSIVGEVGNPNWRKESRRPTP